METIHALQAARLFKLNQRYNTASVGNLANSSDDTRRIIINGLKIFAQAEEERIPFIITGDRRTLARMVTPLRDDGLTQIQALVLAEGFSLSNLGLPRIAPQLSGLATNEAGGQVPSVQQELI